ncbi:MAG: O-antigen ligase family protein, partial [Patescibacteria group bacterium]
MKKINLKIRHELSLVLALLAIPLIIALQLPFVLTVVAFLFSIVFFVAINWPKLGLLLFIFLRPAVDFLYQYRLSTSLPLNFTSIFAILAIIFCLFIIYENRRQLPSISSAWTWIILILIGVASVVYTISFSSTIDEIFRLLSIFLLFVSAYLLFKDPKDLTNLIRTIIFSSVVPVAVGFWQLANDTGLMEEGQNRLLGTFAHPNMLAYFLILPITLATFAALNLGKRRIESYGYAIVSLILVIVLAFTYTRGAYVALALILLIVGLAKFRSFLVVSAIFALIVYVSIPQINARVNSLLNFDPYGSIGWRIRLWTDGFSYFKENPWTGNGLGTGPMVIAENRDFKLGATEPHNDYLRLGLEVGLPGIAAYLAIIFSVILDFFRSFKKQKKPKLKMLTLFSSA